jgi:predicted O-linked N-acetylglucosamine transferase (SPINDLY family)
MTSLQLLQHGMAHHTAGRLQEAEQTYRLILMTDPRNPDAMHLLGVIAQTAGKHDQAAGLIRQAIAVRPGDAVAWGNLGNALGSLGRVDEAADAYRRAFTLDPAHADAHYNLATLFRNTGRFEEAVAEFRAAIAVRPAFGNAVWTLSELLLKHERPAEAVAVCRAYLELNPRDAVMQVELGLAHHKAKRFEESAAAYGRAAELDPTDENAVLGLGTSLAALERLDEAIAVYRKWLGANPNRPAVLTALGGVLLTTGLVDEAVACFRASTGLKPDDEITRGTLLFAMLSQPSAGPAELAAEHRRWNDDFAAKFASEIRPHPNDPDPDRRLRVGYVSSDFHQHTVGVQFLSILEARNRAEAEVTLYAHDTRADAIQARYKATADRWRDIGKLEDDELARLIREDGIDILVDLNVHSGGHRLLAFARKPAPVQITYFGYCGTTGLRTMDYRISDPCLDPPGTDLSDYSEKTVHLDRSYWSYRDSPQAPAVSEAPSVANGFVTFGSMNAFRKVSSPTLAVWEKILAAVPDSRLLIHAPPGNHRRRTTLRLARAGIEPHRISFVGTQRFEDYLGTFGRIDVVLDPFPYAGGITSCDGLWMGVPLVTLAGRQSPVSRGGVSILRNIGLPELIAEDEDQYVSIAVGLANDRDRLVELRRGMRERMRRSPLTDIFGLANNLERIYRRLWRDWCHDRKAGRRS